MGIIPARAGFTGHAGARPPASWDHPRSRGVYVPQSWDTALHTGSSPLARGLRRGRGRGYVLTWDHPRSRGVYSPARAGFTPPLTRGSLLMWDHPRSRGVYGLFVFEGVVGGAYRILRRGWGCVVARVGVEVPR